MRQPLSWLMAVLLAGGGFPLSAFADAAFEKIKAMLSAEEHAVIDLSTLSSAPEGALSASLMAAHGGLWNSALAGLRGGNDSAALASIARFRPAVAAAAGDYLAKDPAELPADGLTPFEDKFIMFHRRHWHPESVSGRYWEKKLADAGESDPDKKKAFAAAWRAFVRVSLKKYVDAAQPELGDAIGRRTLERAELGRRARTALAGEGEDFDALLVEAGMKEAAPAPSPEEDTALPPRLLAALSEKFPDSAEIERLVAAQIILLDDGKQDALAAVADLPEAGRQAAFAALLGGELHGQAVAMIKKHLSGAGTEPPVKAVLDSGKKDDDFLSAYCPRLLHTLTPAQKESKPIWAQANRILTAAGLTFRAPGEDAVGLFNQIYSASDGDGLVGRCEGFLDHKASAAGERVSDFKGQVPSVGAGSTVPAPAGFPAADDKNAAGEDSGGLKGLLAKPGMKEGLSAGVAGGFGFGLMGFLLGGPIGGLVMGAIGAGVLGGIAYLGGRKKGAAQ